MGYCLSGILDGLSKLLFSKLAIICVIVAYCHAHLSSQCLEAFLSLKGLKCQCGLLEVHVSIAAGMINKHGCHLVSGGGEFAFGLCHKSQCCAFQLIHQTHCPNLVDRSEIMLEFCALFLHGRLVALV